MCVVNCDMSMKLAYVWFIYRDEEWFILGFYLCILFFEGVFVNLIMYDFNISFKIIIYYTFAKLP